MFAKKESGGIPLITAGRSEKSPLFYNLYFFVYLTFYELVFHGTHFKLFEGNTLRILGFSLLLSFIPSFLCGLFGGTGGRIVATVFSVLITLLFITQMIYHAVFQNYISLMGTLQYANQAADNRATVWTNIKAHPLLILFFVLPAVLGIFVIWKFLKIRRSPLIISIVQLLAFVVLYPTFILAVHTEKQDAFSAYNVYKNYPSVDMAVEKLGVFETFFVDIRAGITKKNNGSELTFANVTTEEAATTEASRPKTSSATDAALEMARRASATDATTEEVVEIDTSPNVLDLDFAKISEEGGDGVANLSEYFKTLSPTNKNEYTGMFEGYNVIWITAEGFSGYLLKTGMFPTLKRMATEGFNFTNFYTPIWYGSTLGGEYANLTGNPPRNGGYLSMSYSGRNGNTMRFTLANLLNNRGYTSYGFHNNDATYYDRNISHPLLGYDWIANGTGLDAQTNEYGNVPWPQSDLVMIEDTFEKYSKKQPFHLYYLTVSGHVEYNFGGNAMSSKHRDLVENLNYSEKTKAYIACQYELELAMSELISELKMNNLYDKTVIILSADHVPYNDLDCLDELAGHDLSSDFATYKSSLIIFSGAMEESVTVKKPCSSLDILPTVLNLMGLPYDSRLITGQDILSDSPGLVFFPDQSFITDEFAYNAANGRTTHNGYETDVDGATLSYWQSYVANKYIAANGITDYDYYRYIPEDK